MNSNTKDTRNLIGLFITVISVLITGINIGIYFCQRKLDAQQDNPFMDCKQLESSVWRCENDKYTCFEFTYKEGNATQCLNK